MNKSVIVFILFMISNITFSQLNTNKYLVTGKGSVGISDSGMYGTYGLSVERIFKNKFGIMYNLEGISRRNNIGLHLPMGVAGGPVLIAAGIADENDKYSTTSGKNEIIGGILLFLLPDGISYHQDLGYYWDISPYANLLGIEFIYSKQHHFDALKYACSFGIKGSYLFRDNLSGFGYIEARKTGGFPMGVGAGIGVNYSFGKNTTSLNSSPKKENDSIPN